MASMKWGLLWFALVAVSFAFQERECVDPLLQRFSGEKYRFLEDIVFDQKKGLKGDIYLPFRKAPYPALLFIHGGGWTGGAKGLMNSVQMAQFFACRGYAFFDIDYVLAPKQTIKEQVQDCKCALLFLKEKAREWGIDPKKIAVTGGSAGGHLAAMVALTPEVEELRPECVKEGDLRVQAGIYWYGVFDFSLFSPVLRQADFLHTIFGKDVDEQDLAFLSPVTYASAPDLPPSLIIQGTKDGLVPTEQALALTAALAQHNHHVETLFVPDANHAFDAGIADPRARLAFETMLDFLKRVFHEN